MNEEYTYIKNATSNQNYTIFQDKFQEQITSPFRRGHSTIESGVWQLQKQHSDNHKVSLSEWMEFLLNIVRLMSINADSWNNRNAYTTSRYWLEKMFYIASEVAKNRTLWGTNWFVEYSSAPSAITSHTIIWPWCNARSVCRSPVLRERRFLFSPGYCRRYPDLCVIF